MNKLFLFLLCASCNNYNNTQPLFDYTTIHNINVKIGKINRPSKKLIESWSWTAIGFWSSHFNRNIKSLYKINAYFEDGSTIKFSVNKYSGMAIYQSLDDKTSEIYISYGKTHKETKFIFLHEFSHIIIKEIDNKKYPDEIASHNLFDSSGFTERFKYW